MKTAICALLSAFLLLPAAGQVKKAVRKTGIDRDPGVVHLADCVKEPVVLKVKTPAAVFSDKAGRTRLGTLQADQTVTLEAMTEKAYKVRGKGTTNGISGWVAPLAFSSADPDFVASLKKLYHRQIEVTAMIAEHRVAVGMTEEEVGQALGKPEKTQMKQTAGTTSGKWEYVTYENVNHYTYGRHPVTGQVFRQLAGVTREEKEKTVVEFQAGVVTAVEESTQKNDGPVKIIVPPVVFAW